MTPKIPASKKDLLQTDIVFSQWERIQAYVEENFRQITAIGLIVCVVAAGTIFWKVQQAQAERESSKMFFSTMRMMAQESKDTVDKEIRYSQALEGFKNVHQNYPGTQTGTAALFYAGNCSYNLKKYDEAITFYTNFLNKADNTLNYLKTFAYEGLGYAYEAKKEYTTAIEWFAKQNNTEGNMTNPMASLNLARCFETAGEQEKACASYQEFAAQQQVSLFRELAQIKATGLCEQKGE